MADIRALYIASGARKQLQDDDAVLVGTAGLKPASGSTLFFAAAASSFKTVASADGAAGANHATTPTAGTAGTAGTAISKQAGVGGIGGAGGSYTGAVGPGIVGAGGGAGGALTVAASNGGAGGAGGASTGATANVNGGAGGAGAALNLDGGNGGAGGAAGTGGTGAAGAAGAVGAHGAVNIGANAVTAGGSTAAITIGSGTGYGALNLSRSGQATSIKGTFAAEEASTFTGKATFNGNIELAASGTINASSSGAIAIGDGANTSAVNIGKLGAVTTIKGDLAVDGTETVVGNTTFAEDITFGDNIDDVLTFKGQTTSDVGTSAATVAGVGWAYTAGTGGTATAAPLAAGAGGTVKWTGGIGGAAATTAGATAGAGGASSLSGGLGGAGAASGAVSGGNGGAVNINGGMAGAQGAATGTGTGGAVNITGGSDNDNSVGVGGAVVIKGGEGVTNGAIDIGSTQTASLAIGASGITTSAAGTWKFAAVVDIDGSVDFDGTTFDVSASGATSIVTTGTATLTVRGGGISKFGDDIASLDFDGAGAVNETGMTSLSLTPSGAITLTGGAASTWSTGVGALTLTSAEAATWSTSAGDLTLSGAGDLALTAGTDLRFSDGYKAASGFTGELKLAADSADWDDYEALFGEVSLLDALRQAATAGGQVTETTDLAVILGDVLAYDDAGAGAGLVRKADHSGSTILGNAIGFAEATAAEGVAVTVLTGGKITIPLGQWAGDAVPAATDLGKIVYASAAIAGEVTLTAPSTAGQTLQKVGIVAAADGTILIQIGDKVIL